MLYRGGEPSCSSSLSNRPRERQIPTLHTAQSPRRQAHPPRLASPPRSPQRHIQCLTTGPALTLMRALSPNPSLPAGRRDSGHCGCGVERT